MRDELQEPLYKQFPDLYWEHALDMSQSCMHWGLCIGDGWYPILESLSKELSQIISAQNLDPRQYCFAQVKEKWGLLTIYFTQSTKEMSQAADRAMEESRVTCETCGEEGSLTGKECVRVTCDRCEEERRENKKRREARKAERRMERDLELSMVNSSVGRHTVDNESGTQQ